MLRFPKKPRWENQTYLQYIRNQECAGCGKGPPSDPHHFGPGGGMGMKCDDFYTTPLCRVCHTQWHSNRTIGMRTAAESESLQYDSQRRSMAAWIRQFDNPFKAPDANEF